MSEYIPADLRRQVEERANHRCEYCLIPKLAVLLPHQIDHIVAVKHGGRSTADNLALACALCNKHKGTDLTSIYPDSGEIVALFHPRQQNWTDHFEFQEGLIVERTLLFKGTLSCI